MLYGFKVQSRLSKCKNFGDYNNDAKAYAFIWSKRHNLLPIENSTNTKLTSNL